jgi:uncharacterized coiled-coil protein SlyX
LLAAEGDRRLQEEKLSDRVRRLEEAVAENLETTRRLHEELGKTAEILSSIQNQVTRLYKKTFTTCVDCHTEFDLLTHHYSIGLHDNLVFVKCPQCRKDMAIDRIDGLKRE